MPIQEILLNIFFYAFALVALGGGIAVAVSRNIVRSAFALLAVLFAVAAMYGFMRADFILVAQVLIYVGGILVLIIFAVMLTHKITDVRLSNESAPGPAAIFACLCLFFALAAVALSYRWERAAPSREATVPSREGQPPIRLELSMTQGDGRTGVTPGGTVLDGFVRCAVAARGQGGEAQARFRLERGVLKESVWQWSEFRTAEARFRAAEPGTRRAEGSFDRLPPGPYRWSARIEDFEGETAWVAFGSQGEGAAADFVSERGLTKSIGSAFMGPYLLPFELVSVLLLAALVGAAYLARKEVHRQG
ncbi:MAG: NADH-quinone oxidoreductase subunit J [Planctomycetes bacterium]|nr:NADH-quinone oxidoreductase subunit J [Planctomycetota bacterium]